MRLAIIGDFDPNKGSHITTGPALQHAADHLHIGLDVKWIATDTIAEEFGSIIDT